MKYRFKLEALRRFRQSEEDRLQTELADLQRRRDEQQAILAAMIDHRCDTEQTFAHQRNKSINSLQAAMYRRFLERLAGQIQEQQDHVDAADKASENKRVELLAAMKKRKAMDRLKEKGHREFVAERNREEEKFINELAVNRFTRKSS